MEDFYVPLTILVSFVSGMSALLGGWVLIPFISYYQEYIWIKYNHEIDSGVLAHGYITACVAIVSGLNFFYRIYFIYTNGHDFAAMDWLLPNLFTGVFMFLSSYFLLSLYRERRRIEKIVADRNDDQLSEMF
jgi:hypothetical protein